MQTVRNIKASTQHAQNKLVDDLRMIMPPRPNLSKDDIIQTLGYIWVVRFAYETGVLPQLKQHGLPQNKLDPTAAELENDLSILGFELSSNALIQAEHLKRKWAKRRDISCAIAAENFLLLEHTVYDDIYWLQFDDGYKFRYRTKSVEFREDLHFERMEFFDRYIGAHPIHKILTDVLICYANIGSVLSTHQRMTVAKEIVTPAQ